MMIRKINSVRKLSGDIKLCVCKIWNSPAANRKVFSNGINRIARILALSLAVSLPVYIGGAPAASPQGLESRGKAQGEELQTKVFKISDYKTAEILQGEIKKILSKTKGSYVEIYQRADTVIMVVKDTPSKVKEVVFLIEEIKKNIVQKKNAQREEAAQAQAEKIAEEVSKKGELVKPREHKVNMNITAEAKEAVPGQQTGSEIAETKPSALGEKGKIEKKAETLPKASSAQKLSLAPPQKVKPEEKKEPAKKEKEALPKEALPAKVSLAQAGEGGVSQKEGEKKEAKKAGVQASRETVKTPQAEKTTPKELLKESKEPAKKETAKKEVAKKEVAKKEAVKKEVIKKEAAKKEGVKKETVKKETVKKETVKENKIPLPLPKVSLNFKDASLSEVLNTLSKLADINIVGADDLSVPVTLYVNNVPLDKALNSLLKGVGYTYIKEKGFFYILPASPGKDKPLGGFLKTKVFSLNYVSASSIKDNLSALLTPQGEVKIFSDVSEEKNSRILVVRDFPKNIEAVSQLIKELDKKPLQVRIETKFVEVTLDKDNQAGIDWGEIAVTIKGANAETPIPFGAKGERIPGVSHITKKTMDITTLGTVTFSTVTAALKLQDQNIVTKVINSPTVTTHSGEEAKITVGKVVPIALWERDLETGTMEITGYQDEEIGAVLKVTPIINKDNTLTIYLEPKVTEDTGSTVGSGQSERPIITTSSLKTIVTIKDGDTLVLGGLRKKKNNNTYRGVPFLQKLPLFGKFFQYEKNERDETELVIFITPHIVRSQTKEIKKASAEGKIDLGKR